MDLASIVGVIAGVILLIASILMNSGLGIFIDIPSLIIVLGGATCATLVAFPLKEVFSVITAMIKVFIFKIAPPEELIKQLLEISNKARKGGLLSIESDVATIKDPFLAKSLQMTVDGISTADIASIMQKKISLQQKDQKLGIEIMGKLGEFCPAFGMVGTLIGLVQMLATLDDPSTIGPKMAVAMITTFYGSFFANLFFIPMANKLKRRSDQENLNMNLLYEGVISIREGEHPRIMEDKLNVYIFTSQKGKDKDKKDKGK